MNHDFETWSQVAIDETRWTELLPQYVAWRMNRSGLNKLSPGEDPDNIYILKTDFDERDLKNAEPDSKDTEGACELRPPRKHSWCTSNESSVGSDMETSSTSSSSSDTEEHSDGSTMESKGELDAAGKAFLCSPALSSGLSPDTDLE